MDEIADDINTLVLKADETDAHVDTGGGTFDGSYTNENSVTIGGAQDVAHGEQTTQHDAKPLDIEENVDDLEARGDDHGAASTDARMLGCLGSTDSAEKVSMKWINATSLSRGASSSNRRCSTETLMLVFCVYISHRCPHYKII
jgi:hypothetical protein